MATTSQSNNFDFTAYNALMKNVGTGLKLHLGVQLLRDVAQSLDYFDNPLASEIGVIVSDLKAFHAVYKEAAKKVAAARQNPSERSAQIDNSTVPTIGVQDMMKMFAEFQRMQAAMVAGNAAAAQNAATSIDQIGAGELHAQGEATGTNG